MKARTITRRTLIKTRLDKMVRAVDTFYYVYTKNCLLALVCLSLAIVVPFLDSNLVGLLLVLIATPFTTFIFTIIRDYKYVNKALSNSITLVHLWGDFLRLKKMGRRHFCDLGTGIIGIKNHIHIYVHVLDDEQKEVHLVPNKKTRTGVEITIENSRCEKTMNGFLLTYHLSILPIIVSRSKKVIELVLYKDQKRVESLFFKYENIESVQCVSRSPIVEIRVKGWKYGKKAAVCWRSDFCFLWPQKGMDKTALENLSRLIKKWGMPVTLFISSRLVLDKDEVVRTLQHFGLATREQAEKIYDDFITFLQMFDIEQYTEYPNFVGSLSIGNHGGYFHPGRVAGQSIYNKWESGWSSQDGKIEWLLERWRMNIKLPIDYTFNQLNSMLNSELINDILGVKPYSWSAPRDETTSTMATELEKIGVKYASGADNYKRISIRFIPRRPKASVVLPYHPTGCHSLVESRCIMNPHDPDDIFDFASLKKSVKFCIESGAQITFLIHPHLRLRKKRNSIKFVEGLFLFLSENLDSLWVASHENLLNYWENVFCPIHRVIVFDIKQGRVINMSNKPLEHVPILIRFANGWRMVRIITLKPHETFSFLEFLGLRACAD